MLESRTNLLGRAGYLMEKEDGASESFEPSQVRRRVAAPEAAVMVWNIWQST